MHVSASALVVPFVSCAALAKCSPSDDRVCGKHPVPHANSYECNRRRAAAISELYALQSSSALYTTVTLLHELVLAGMLVLLSQPPHPLCFALHGTATMGDAAALTAVQRCVQQMQLRAN
eukprot:8624-Heterococcus_DN1.PRE.2